MRFFDDFFALKIGNFHRFQEGRTDCYGGALSHLKRTNRIRPTSFRQENKIDWKPYGGKVMKKRDKKVKLFANATEKINTKKYTQKIRRKTSRKKKKSCVKKGVKSGGIYSVWNSFLFFFFAFLMFWRLKYFFIDGIQRMIIWNGAAPSSLNLSPSFFLSLHFIHRFFHFFIHSSILTFILCSFIHPCISTGYEMNEIDDAPICSGVINIRRKSIFEHRASLEMHSEKKTTIAASKISSGNFLSYL